MGVEALERRDLCSVQGSSLPAASRAHRQLLVQTGTIESNHPAGTNLVAHPSAIKAARKQNFSLAQLSRMLPGKWHVAYDASSLFGPGAFGVQEITFTGPKGAPSFVSTTGVVVPGFFGPAYYQFSSWGTYRFVTKSLVRLTITGAAPIEYLNSGIIVMSGQSMPIQFQGRDQFVVQGQVYHRIPLDSGAF